MSECPICHGENGHQEWMGKPCPRLAMEAACNRAVDEVFRSTLEVKGIRVHSLKDLSEIAALERLWRLR